MKYIIRYSPSGIRKDSGLPIITTQTFESKELAEKHGLENLNIREDTLIVEEVRYTGNEWDYKSNQD
jgi:hypothetical protein